MKVDVYHIFLCIHFTVTVTGRSEHGLVTVLELVFLWLCIFVYQYGHVEHMTSFL